jgi:putative transposase
MARKPRQVLPGTPHHVYDRGNNRRRLFSYSTDRMRFLYCLSAGLEESGCSLQQLTLMSNHVHMIVTPQEVGGLAKLMKRTKHRYAQMRNSQRGGSGSLFEARFKSKPITSVAQLMATTLYNDANARRAGLIHSGTAHEWSTGPLHAARPGSRVPADMWTPSAWYLGLGRTSRDRGDVYEELMDEYLRSDPGPPQDWAIAQEVEQQDLQPYTQRLERPRRTSAREPSSSRYGEKALL